jgi:hypothetical protein
MQTTVPVLTYHSMRNGPDYSSNDHVALAEDLDLIDALGLRIIALDELVDHFLADRLDRCGGCVCVSLDDGVEMDWRDLEHPTRGLRRGMAEILMDFARRTGRESVPATSFVIASPEARRRLDQTCMMGRGWWGDDWWPRAGEKGLSVGNHSWDHNHDTLTEFTSGCGTPGSFNGLDDYAACDLQIRRAADYIDSRLGGRQPQLFAYPYGEYSDYLAHTYLPRYQHEHRQRAAFTTAGEPVRAGCDRWLLPRFVCGQHWRSPGELEGILRP